MVNRGIIQVLCSPSEAVLTNSPYSSATLNLLNPQIEPSSPLLIPLELLDKLFSNTAVPLIIMKLANRTILNANNAFLDLLGYEKNEIIDHNVLELGLLTEERTFKACGQKLKSGISVLPIEQRIRSKEGAIKTVIIAAEPFLFLDDTLALLSLVDITSNKRTEEQLCQALHATLEDAASFTQLVMQKLAEVSVNGENHLEISGLTHREKQVLEYMAEGYSNSVISSKLQLAPHTIRNYVTQIYDKLNVHSRVEAVLWARERGLVNHN